MVKNFKFWTGFFMIFGFIASSIIFSVFFDSHVRQVQVLYDENMTPIEAAPFEPSFMFPLGTDPLGYDTAAKVLQGAKFTLISVIVIGILRVLISLAIAIPLAFYMPEKIRKGLDQCLSSFYFIPLTIIAVFILTPILSEQVKMPEMEEYFIYSFTERIGLEIFILTLLVVPLLGSMIANLMASTLEEDFIEGANVLGASRWRIFMKHVMPHLLPKLIIVWCQQCVQVLIIFTHLGYLKLFFGGTDIDYNPFMADPPKSLSNEWSGLVGNYYTYIQANPAIALGPIIMFGVAIYAFQLMAEGFQKHLETRNRKTVKQANMIKQQKESVHLCDQFQFLQNRGA
jgi:peptide/nickel transport system permease protein